jgi:hypothetical protein
VRAPGGVGLPVPKPVPDEGLRLKASRAKSERSLRGIGGFLECTCPQQSSAVGTRRPCLPVHHKCSCVGPVPMGPRSVASDGDLFRGFCAHLRHASHRSSLGPKELRPRRLCVFCVFSRLHKPLDARNRVDIASSDERSGTPVMACAACSYDPTVVPRAGLEPAWSLSSRGF